MLTVEGLQASYGDSRVLFGIDLSVARGERILMIEPNRRDHGDRRRDHIGGILAPAHASFQQHEIGRRTFLVADVEPGAASVESSPNSRYTSSTQTSETAVPVTPARPVRPMR